MTSLPIFRTHSLPLDLVDQMDLAVELNLALDHALLALLTQTTNQGTIVSAIILADTRDLLLVLLPATSLSLCVLVLLPIYRNASRGSTPTLSRFPL